MPSFLKNTAGGKAISGGALQPRGRRGNTNQVASYWAGSTPPPDALVVTYGLQGGGGGTFSCAGDIYFSSGAAAGVFRTVTITVTTNVNRTLPVVIGAGGGAAAVGASTTWNGITATGGNGSNRVACGGSNADFSGNCSRLGGDYPCNGSGAVLDPGQGYGGGAGSHSNACLNGSGGDGHYETFTTVGTGIGGGGVVGPAAGAQMNASVAFGGATGTYGGAPQTAPANRGGGASGGGHPFTCVGGSGGSGRCYIKYLTADALGLTITGGTKTFNGSFTVHDITANTDLVITRD